MKIVWTLSSISELSGKSKSERRAIWDKFRKGIQWPQKSIYYLCYGLSILIAFAITMGMNFTLFYQFREAPWFYSDWFSGVKGAISGATYGLGLAIGTFLYRSIYYSRFRSEFVTLLDCLGEQDADGKASPAIA